MTKFAPLTLGCALAATTLLSLGCGTETSARIDPALPSLNSREVATAMAGNYSNEEQSKIDRQFESLVLHMRPIWIDRIDGLWLYVEQSKSSDQDKPYRQRVYQVVDGNDAESVESRLFDFADNPQQYAGEWKKDRPLNSLTRGLLVPRSGCTVTFRRDAVGAWIGSTTASECTTTYHGAAYTMSDVTLTLRSLNSWDRGYDNSGVQVWGSTTGPYRFVKSQK